GSMNRYIFNVDGSAAVPMQRGDFYTFGPGTQQNQASSPDFELYRKGNAQGFSQAEVKQLSFFLGADYEVNDDLTLFGHFIHGNIESNGEGTRGFPGQNSIWYMTIYRENPFLPANVAAQMDAQGLDSF